MLLIGIEHFWSLECILLQSKYCKVCGDVSLQSPFLVCCVIILVMFVYLNFA